MKNLYVYLGALQDYFAKNKTLPSYSVIANLLGFKSRSAVQYLFSKLSEMNYLEMSPDNRLKPGPKFFERSITHNPVQAELPSLEFSQSHEILTVDGYLVNKPSKTVMIPVKGNSMKDAGILDGDLVVVERQHNANLGDIVVAIVDDNFTLKTLSNQNGKFILKPANSDYPVIHPEGKLEIFGVVTGQFRKY